MYVCIYMHTYMSFPGGVTGKESACKAGDLGDVDLIPGWGRSPGGGHGNPLQYSCLEDSTQKGAWQAIVRGVQRVRHNLTNERTHTHMLAKSLQSCPTLCDPTDHSPPGSSVHGILRARILEWVAMPFSRGSS